MYPYIHWTNVNTLSSKKYGTKTTSTATHVFICFTTRTTHNHFSLSLSLCAYMRTKQKQQSIGGWNFVSNDAFRFNNVATKKKKKEMCALQCINERSWACIHCHFSLFWKLQQVHPCIITSTSCRPYAPVPLHFLLLFAFVFGISFHSSHFVSL